jgi:hypothetical protein
MNVLLPKAGELWQYRPKDNTILLDGLLMIWPDEVVMFLYDGPQQGFDDGSAHYQVLCKNENLFRIWENSINLFVKV